MQIAELPSIPLVICNRLRAVLTRAITSEEQVQIVFERHRDWLDKALGAGHPGDELLYALTMQVTMFASLLDVVPQDTVASVYASASDSSGLLDAVDIANSTTRADLGKELQNSSMTEVEKTVLLMFAPEELL